MSRSRTVRSPQEISSILRHFDESDLSVAAFCREADLPGSTLHLWLRKRATGRPRPACTFQRVEILPSAHSPTPGLELSLPCGITLRVHGLVDPDQLELAIASVLACSD